MNIRRILLIGLGVLVVTLAILVVVFLPAVEEISPMAIEGGLPRTTPITITFSRPMQHDSVEERFSITPETQGSITWEDNTLFFTPAEEWTGGTDVSVRLASGARSNLGLPLRQETSWEFKIAPLVLAYLWPAEGNSEIYLFDPAADETLQLTDAGSVLAYDVSPDSRLFYYFAENSQNGSDLYVIDRFAAALGEDPAPKRLFTCQRALCTTPVVSPDGAQLAYLRNDSQIWVVDLSDPAEMGVQISPEGRESRTPLWSPKGLLTYYDADESNYVIHDLETGTESTLPNDVGEAAAWLPTGSALISPEAFITETDILRGPSGEEENQEVDESELEPVRVLSSHLMVYQLGSSQTLDLTEDDLAEDFSPVFSPSGDILAFTRRYVDEARLTLGRQIWILSLPGGRPANVPAKQLTTTSDYHYTALAWHPDGEQLAAVRFNYAILTDPPEIWLISLNGNAAPLVLGGYAPKWIP